MSLKEWLGLSYGLVATVMRLFVVPHALAISSDPSKCLK